MDEHDLASLLRDAVNRERDMAGAWTPGESPSFKVTLDSGEVFVVCVAQVSE